ncbi:MAG: methyltransferase domain-containing protein [Nitrospira sp.]|nr:methyltransferase domain-containing protein [Nitrospira sp.]
MDVIYSPHALEHIYFEEAPALLQDAYRSLKKDGLIRFRAIGKPVGEGGLR